MRDAPKTQREHQRETDGEGLRGIERRQRISDFLGGIKRNHQQRARAQCYFKLSYSWNVWSEFERPGASRRSAHASEAYCTVLPPVEIEVVSHATGLHPLPQELWSLWSQGEGWRWWGWRRSPIPPMWRDPSAPVHAQKWHTPIFSQRGLISTVNAAAPICCPPIARSLLEAQKKLSFSNKKTAGFTRLPIRSLRPENHIFCFEVPEMPLKAHASSSLGAKNRW